MADEPEIQISETTLPASERDGVATADEARMSGDGAAAAVRGASREALRDFSVVAEKRGVQREHLQLLGLSAGALVFSFLVMLFVRYGATGAGESQ